MKNALLLALLVSTSAQAAPANGRDFGIGAELGEPTGFVAKYWRNNTSAFDFGLSYSFSDFLLLYADDLYHFVGAFKSAKDAFVSQLTPYVGIGLELFFSGNTAHAPNGPYFTSSSGSTVGLGARIPLGVEWLAPKDPVGLFLEIVPGIGFIPSTFGFVQADIGGRYYF